MKINIECPLRGFALLFKKGLMRFCAILWLIIFTTFVPALAYAADTICARVKIEIKQELTLERQGFDAQMKINNTTVDGIIQNVSVVVIVTDENGTPVAVSDNPNNTTAKFFLRVSGKQNITDITGTGAVNPQSSAVINWLLIPAPGSAGASPFGKKYLVGATLKYTFAGEDTVVDVSPDVITVKPLPLLTLDYFLTQNVWADDPLTPEIEPVEPFTLGVRVNNEGQATAKNLKIDSAQPKIIENNQGLLINFMLTGSFVDDASVQNSLLIDFGDIAAGSKKMGRWVMETTLAGKFTEFTAKFSHADELGGTLTSLIKATNAHFLIHDVQVDLLGRDNVRDFLAQDADVIRVYESDAPDTLVTDRSSVATLTLGNASSTNPQYQLSFPATAGFAYVRLPDPFNGKKVLGQVVRSDAKLISPDNIWLSKTRNEQTKQWEYWVNFFDVNTTGLYNTEFTAPPVSALAPVLQFIPDRLVQETKQVSFLIEASSPQGKTVTISAAPLPQGASVKMQPADPSAPGLYRAIFDWTPLIGQAGNYSIVYTVTDGSLSSQQTANIKVDPYTPPPGPETPSILAPLSGAELTTLTPTLGAQASTNPADLTKQLQFEVYADAAMTQLVASSLVDKAPLAAGNGAGGVPQLTTWVLPIALLDNTHYWWRTRAFDGTVYSLWANAQFFVNLFNDPPNSFNLLTPDPDAEVATLTPSLTWNNSIDKDGNAINYSVSIFKDAGLSELIATVADLKADISGSTSWLDTVPLVNHSTYYWKVVATDSLGAQTASFARPFIVNTINTAPTKPVIISPALSGQSVDVNTELKIENSFDAEGDAITYVFELDTVNTFDSAAKQSSGLIMPGAAGTTTWLTSKLTENQHYWWRVKAGDGRTDSDWVVGNFLMNAVNDAPATPTIKNPGNGSWSSILQPTLEANSVVDPEGGAVRYQFEVYIGTNLTNKVTEGVSVNNTLVVPISLTDKTTYQWRVRALDVLDAASDWSVPSIMYVSTGPYQLPTIGVTSPATIVVPDYVKSGADVRKQLTISWEGIDPNIEATVALYYDTQQSGFAGTLIVNGLIQNAGQQTGSYVWDVTNLAPGTYYFYATISDMGGIGKAYAPGALVIPNDLQTGKLLITSNKILRTSETSSIATFNVRLGSAPTANVNVPVSSTNALEGLVAPASLIFTADNWAVNQLVTVAGKDDCAPDGNKIYQVISGKVISKDPNYIGITGLPIGVVNLGDNDLVGTTNNPNMHICGNTILTERQLSPNLWEYSVAAQFTNSGVPINGLTAKLVTFPVGWKLLKNTLIFGATRQGDTVSSQDSLTIQSPNQVSADTFKQGIGFKWDVTVLP